MIKGLADYKKDDKNEKKKTTSYVGGEKSGMAVETQMTLTPLSRKLNKEAESMQLRGRLELHLQS